LDQQEQLLTEERTQFEQHKEAFELEKKRVEDINLKSKNIIVINVGGKVFSTSQATLTSHPNSMLAAMFSGRYTLITDERGNYFIDRDPSLFEYILKYLRTGKLRCPEELNDELQEELDYFGLKNDVTDSAISSNVMISGGSDRSIKLWDASGKCVGTLNGHQGNVNFVTVANDMLISAGGKGDESIRIWDFNSGNCVNVLKSRYVLGINCIAVWRDYIFTGDAHIDMWQLTTGQHLNTMTVPSPVWCLAALNHRIITGHKDGTIQIRDLKSGIILKKLIGHTGTVNSVFVRNNVVCSGSEDCTIKLWDLVTGQATNTLRGHTGAVVCFAMINNKLISGSQDSTVRVWDLSTGSIIHTLSGHQGTIWSVSSFNNSVLSGGEDGTLKSWDLETGSLINSVSAHVGGVRSLTCV